MSNDVKYRQNQSYNDELFNDGT